MLICEVMRFLEKFNPWGHFESHIKPKRDLVIILNLYHKVWKYSSYFGRAAGARCDHISDIKSFLLK